MRTESIFAYAGAATIAFFNPANADDVRLEILESDILSGGYLGYYIPVQEDGRNFMDCNLGEIRLEGIELRRTWFTRCPNRNGPPILSARLEPEELIGGQVLTNEGLLLGNVIAVAGQGANIQVLYIPANQEMNFGSSWIDMPVYSQELTGTSLWQRGDAVSIIGAEPIDRGVTVLSTLQNLGQGWLVTSPSLPNLPDAPGNEVVEAFNQPIDEFIPGLRLNRF